MEDNTKRQAGRPFGKEVRIHKTYWVSETEHQFISSYLRKRRQRGTKTGPPGRNRFAEKKELILEKQAEQKLYERRQKKLLRELEELKRISGKTDTN